MRGFRKRHDRERNPAIHLRQSEEEPVSPHNSLLNLNNVVCTPRVAGLSASRTMATRMTAEILRVLRGERPKALGNPELWPKLSHLR